jgi:hypothetical protein
MPTPSASIQWKRRALLATAAALIGLAVIPTLSPRRSFAVAEVGWRGGQYRDSTSEVRDGVTTRSTRGPVALAQTTVQRPRLKPGDAATLRATYEVSGPTEVRETRVIQYDGAVLARIERVVSRTGGSVVSEYRVNVPKDAAEGWYAVTTTVEPTAATTRSATGSSTAGGQPGDQKQTGFYVALAEPTERPKPSPPPSAAAPATGEPPILVKLWADQKQYRVGDRLTLSFEANRDAYVTLVNVGTSGEVTILFPNRFSGGNGVKSGKTYRIPDPADGYELQVKGPPGVELIYALVTLKAVLFMPTDFPASGPAFRSMTEQAPGFTRDINVVAKSIPLREQAKATLELEILR